MSARYSSWGRYPKVNQKAKLFNWRDDALPEIDQTVLPFGRGRSYGDSCLNREGFVLSTQGLNRFIQFDADTGVLSCESGVTLAEIIDSCLPQGWFLPVTPGTKYVSVGGAIANDVHGKNHHRDGNFGHHVKRFELLRSNGERLMCSASENTELFYATIGGLGLTGLITWAEVQLKSVNSDMMDVESIRFANLHEFKQLTQESSEDFLYTVAWVDCLARGSDMGRGIFMRGNHAEQYSESFMRKGVAPFGSEHNGLLKVPVDFPSFTLNSFTIKNFNRLYFYKQFEPFKRSNDYFDQYFYPLDSIGGWNKIYGKRGFFQYQFVVPSDDYTVIEEVFSMIARSGAGSFLAVLKEFGDIPSLGMLSFPREGVCLALDFPNRGQETLDLLDRLDEVVRAANGAVYPAKDARMSAQSFAQYFPRLNEFLPHIDEKFSSDFWRRVNR